MWDIGHQSDIDTDIDMEYGVSILDMVYRYGHHPGYRYGTWADDMRDDSIDVVISHVDMGYLVTLDPPGPALRVSGVQEGAARSELKRGHPSAQHHLVAHLRRRVVVHRPHSVTADSNW